jgi:hypothetical protein
MDLGVAFVVELETAMRRRALEDEALGVDLFIIRRAPRVYWMSIVLISAKRN